MDMILKYNAIDLHSTLFLPEKGYNICKYIICYT